MAGSKPKFPIEAITNFSDLESLVDPFELKRAESEIRYRFTKLLYKRFLRRGINPSFEARLNLRDGIRARVYLDTYLRAALNQLALIGYDRAKYHGLAYAIFKQLRKADLGKWPRILEGFIKGWTVMYQLDPKIALFTAIATAKISFQLRFGRLRPPKPSKRELYPELEGEV